MNYDEILSSRVKEIGFSGIRKFFDLASNMKDIVSLGVGEPDFPTPWAVRDHAISQIRKGVTQYTSNAGDITLRKNISRYLKERFSLDYSTDELLVTIGASEPIDLAMRILVNPGDEVLVPAPSYVSYSPCVRLSGGVAVEVPCFEEDNFKLTRENLLKAITPKTKAIIFPYPNNPTGAVMRKDDIDKIIDVIISNDLIVISDEIYAELTYNSKHISIASFDNMKERTIYINGFSKSFSMTGWRVGYVAAPRELLRQMLKIHQYTAICAPIMSQFAGSYALEQGFNDNFSCVEDMRNEYNVRRRFVIGRFNDLGLSCFEAEGAFYVFPSVKSLGMTGTEFAERLLAEGKVAVVPGSAFSDVCDDFIRVSYAYSMKMLTKAMDKIEIFVNSLKKEKETK